MGISWLWNQPGNDGAFQRMNSVEMIRENCRIASETQAGAFTEDEIALVNELRHAINHSMKWAVPAVVTVPCRKV
ncbi:MAG: hypothetical protein ACLTDV_12910 [Eubacterium sp.]